MATPIVQLQGHLTQAAVVEALAVVDDGSSELIVDCIEMTSYDADARAQFVEWHREHKAHITRVAVITDKPLWRMVISAMSLASGQTMRAFSERAEAEQWIGG